MKNKKFIFLLFTFIYAQGEGGENVDIIGYLEFGLNTSDITSSACSMALITSPS